MSDLTSEMSEAAFRFHRANAWFTCSRQEDLHVVEIQANSERIMELLHRLSVHLDSVVDVHMTHVRDGAQWQGIMRFLPEVREAVGRLRWPLAAYGGVELALVTPEDQLTVTPELQLVIYSRNSVWVPRLRAEGIEQCVRFPAAVWNPLIRSGSPTPDLTLALAAIAERLDLEPCR